MTRDQLTELWLGGALLVLAIVLLTPVALVRCVLKDLIEPWEILFDV